MYEVTELRRGILEIFHDAQASLRDRYQASWATVAAETRAAHAARERALTAELHVLRRLRGAPRTLIEPLPRPFACACGECFGSPHGLRTHSFQMHGVSLW